MRHFYTFLCLFILFGSGAFAQNSIEGSVLDDSKNPIFFATISIFNSVDSTLVKAESSDNNGKFTIQNIKNGAYYLKASLLGYTDYYQSNISFPEKDKKTFNITLSEATNLIEGVEITARVPLLEQKSDRLIVNVENNITSMNSSLMDVMKKVPGMIVTGDQLRMAGQRNMTILLNGKSTRYMDIETLLRDMPGDNIKKIEVIHQPGAEFEASGTGPIINIVLKKNTLYGTNGSVSLGVGKGRNWKMRSGASVSHYAGKLNINAGVGYRNSPWYDELQINRRINDDIYTQVGKDPNFSQNYRANLTLDYDITDKQRIGISSRYNLNDRDNQVVNNTFIDYGDELVDDIDLQTLNNEERQWNLISVNPYYTYNIDTSGRKITLDYNYAQFSRDGINTLNNTILNSEVYFPSQQFDQVGLTKIQAAKIDYTHPINKNLSFQTGAKYSFADLDNNFKAFDEDTKGEFALNTMQSNQFLFTEEIIGLYAKSNWQFKKWSGTLGLRYEDSDSKGRSVQSDTILSREINQFFPSLSIAREVVGPLKASVAYSYRIDRPRYSTLNPFRFYLDPFTFERGNPQLRPAFTHSAKFNLSYEGQPFFNVEYKDTKDAMVEIIEQNDESGQTNQTTFNLDHFRIFNTSLFFPLDFIPKITGYGGVIANYSIFESELQSIELLRNRWSFTTFLQTNFTLPGKINSEITGWYNSGELDGVITGEYLYGVDIGFSRKFIDNKMKVSFGIDNLFFRPFYGNVEYSTVDLDVVSIWDAPVANVQISYKFGNQSLKKKEKVGGGANDIIRRAEND